MRRIALTLGVALVLAGCGGQSASQKLHAACDSYGRQWAASFTAPMPNQSAGQVAQLAASASRLCVDAGGPDSPQLNP